MEEPTTHFPTGALLADASAGGLPDPARVADSRVRLVRPDAEVHATTLWHATHGPDADDGQWTYMGYGPFADAAAMAAWMASVATGTDPLFLVVESVDSGEPVGMVSFMNIVPRNRTLELGNIWYVPAVRRSMVNTATIHLMLREAFDALGYRRVEWKCDSLNARSRAAAARLGFSFEGIFAQHMIIKGRNRDTAWFAMTDQQWPAIRDNFARVLDGPPGGASLRELNAPLLAPTVRLAGD